MITEKSYVLIPVRDINGFPVDKMFRVLVGGSVHKKLLAPTGKLPLYMVDDLADQQSPELYPIF